MKLKGIPKAEWSSSPGIVLSQSGIEIVQSEENLAVMAGPGAGKTELLAQRASFLLQTGLCPPPRRILAISFKVDAAANLRSRVQQRCGSELAARLNSLTFDSFAKGLLDRYRRGIDKTWRPNANYDVGFPRPADWEEFITSLANDEENISTSNELRAIQPNDLERRHAPRLPPTKRLTDVEPDTAFGIAIVAWWKAALFARNQITFRMIRRLAQLIVEANPEVRNLLLATYSHVFLDEFQDTTSDQYDLLTAIFKGRNSVVTAVGDVRQAIMGWAGAKPKIFESFEKDFDARTVPLLVNHRSNSAIVHLINEFRQSLWQDAEPIECARRDEEIPPHPIGRRRFADQETEAEFLADFIYREVDNGQRMPEDFALLVRVFADQLEKRLRQEFVKRGLVLRNEARTLTNFTIQDIVKEPLFDYLIAILKLAVRVQDGLPFQAAESFLANVQGVDLSNARDSSKIHREFRNTVEIIRETIGETRPPDSDIPQLLSSLFESIPANELMNSTPSLAQVDRYNQFLASFDLFFRENTKDADSWRDVVDLLEGRGQVRLMTIHKSKGLEFHTVFFLDLHDGSWFSTGEGEQNSFFVALSRARERVYFLNSDVHQGSHRLAEFNKVLRAAGVPTMN